MEHNPYFYYAKVVNVVDGDTYDLLFDLGMHVSITERVRLYGVNTPEIYGVKKESEEYSNGVLAKNRVTDLIYGKTILVETIKDKQGKYGRYLVNIYLDNNMSLADLLVAENLAQVKSY